MSANPWILAIDFGTSNSAAAHSGATSGSIETLSLTHTSHLMPSAVYLENPDQISVGDAAINAAQHNPAGFVASPKRLIGGNPTSTINGYTVPTAVLVSAVLRTIIGRAVAAHAGTPPTQLVLTHPEAWSPQQIQVLVDAAAGAGHPPAQIVTISEPRAAAAHYSRSHAMQPGAKIAVFDFGGGTLDIAVLTVTGEGTFQVIAARGNNGLGGKNLDALIQRWVHDRLGERDPDLVDWLRRQAPVDVAQAVQESIRRAKELLSEAPSATITIPTPSGRTTLQLTRDEFDELITPTVTEALHLTRATLLDAGISHPDQVTALYLTGGSSRIPRIQQELGGLGPVATLDDPKTVVAQGAVTTAAADAAPTTAERAALPGAADLMPSWHAQTAPTPGRGQPTTPRLQTPQFDTPTDTATRSRRWPRIVAVGVAAVAVIGIGTGAVMLTRDDSSPADSGSSAAASSTAAAGQATGTDGGTIITDENALKNTLPGPLQAEVTNCHKQGFSDNDALEMNCTLSTDGTLAPLLKAGTSQFINFHVDNNDADSRIVNLRNGVYTQGTGTLVESSDRLSAAEISGPDTDGGDTSIDFADTNSGLVLTAYGLNSIDDARTFLTRAGLIS